MKVGIITYWESDDNYGQLLQCWALQQFLIRQGHSPFLIRFKRYTSSAPGSPVVVRKSLLKKFVGSIRRVLAIILVFPYLQDKRRRKARREQLLMEEEMRDYSNRRNRERQFDHFRETSLFCSDVIYPSLESLRHDPPEADLYITGSDQVWNYEVGEERLAAYFLQFGSSETKRISYAPSIAHSDWPDELHDTLCRYLSSFEALSVREDSARLICQRCGYDALCVLDPTMLLSSEDYMMSEEVKQMAPSPFVYIYSINYCSSEDVPWNDIQAFAKHGGMVIRVTPGSGYTPCMELFDGVEYDYATIPGWIDNVRKASLLVTASFHGIVFAVLHHTPFVYTPLKGRFSYSNTRALDLLHSLGLQSRILSEENAFSQIMDSEIDWAEVDAKVASARLLSVAFIEKHLCQG